MNEREEVLSRVQAALPVFKEINDLYLTANNLDQQVMMRNAKQADSNGKTGGILAYVAAIACFAVMDILYRIVVRATNSGVVALIWIILSIALSVYVYIRVRRKIKSRSAFSENELAAQRQQIEAISDEICRIYEENQDVIENIPRDYRYYDAVSFLEASLANGRADSMKEALNQYELYLHQKALEMNSRASLELNRQQCAMMASIESHARNAERNSGIAAAFSIFNFLSRSER